MARAMQASFTSGEWAPTLFGRTDIDRYDAGAKTLENVIVLKEGGAVRRSGTKYVAEVKDSSKATRLVEFKYAISDSYILEFGDSYIRFFRDQGQLFNGAVETEISSPYAEADLPALKFAQSADVLFIAHPDYAPRELSRTAAGADTLPGTWSLTAHDYRDGPYLPRNTTTTTLTPSATTGSITITASASLFASTDVGRQVRISNPASGENWGWATITAFTNATTVTATVNKDFATTNATDDWYLGAWSDTTGYPRCVSFHDARLWWASTDDRVQMMWSSQVNDFDNYGPTKQSDGTIRDTDAIIREIASNQVNAVYWLVSDAKGLIAMTAGGIFKVTGETDEGAITPANFTAKRQTTVGVSELVRPHMIGAVNTFIASSNQRANAIEYSFEADSLQDRDLTLLAGHVLAGGATSSASLNERSKQLWVSRADGTLCCLTMELSNNVLAWSRCVLGGSFGEGQAVVESIASIRDGDDDVIWCVVKRTINATTRRYIEYMLPPFDYGEAVDDAYQVDAGLTYDGAAVATIGGLSHLEGETVQVVVDGAVHPTRRVQGGAIDLDGPASKVHVGLAYDSEGETLPLAPVSRRGDVRGIVLRPDAAYVQLYQSSGIEVAQGGEDASALSEIVPARTIGDTVGEAPPLFSGWVDVSPIGSATRDPTIRVIQRNPLPMTILNIATGVQSGAV
jgi:hypothetical protein